MVQAMVCWSLPAPNSRRVSIEPTPAAVGTSAMTALRNPLFCVCVQPKTEMDGLHRFSFMSLQIFEGLNF